MDLPLKKLVLNLIPVTMLVFVLAAGHKLVQSEPLENGWENNGGKKNGGERKLQTPATPQTVLIEAKSIDSGAVQAEPPADGEGVWTDINDAISNLNKLVGAEMFLEVKRAEKGQMEVRLDKGFWDRVQYKTRVELKTDISDLWHLYATQYNYVESSVVYFIDDTNGKVIDIFSKVK